MSELGRHLKEARLQKGMSLDDVQEVTKIRKNIWKPSKQGIIKCFRAAFMSGPLSKPMPRQSGLTRMS